MILYKYHKANDYLLEIIKRNSLWCSNPNDFNDPFDMRFLIDYKSLYDQLRSDAEKDFNMKYPALTHLIPNAIQGVTDEQLNDFVLEWNEKVISDLKRFGICSLSKKQDDLLMWSHYTDKYNGVCLKFDFSEKSDISFMPLPVKYSDEFPSIRPDEVPNEHFCITKSSDWKYEEEFRIIAPKQGYVSFNKGCLKEVIFGFKVTHVYMKEVIDVAVNCGYENLTYKTVKINNEKYQLDFLPLNLPLS